MVKYVQLYSCKGGGGGRVILGVSYVEDFSHNLPPANTWSLPPPLG